MKKATSSKISILSLFFGLVAAAALLLAGYGYQWNWWELGTAFTWIIPGSAVAGLIATGLTVTYWFAKRKNWAVGTKKAMTGLLLGIIVMGTVGYWFYEAMQYPPIHDISTDVKNPPVFKNIVALRADAANDTTYGDQEKVDIQRKHYPDIKPVLLDMSYGEAFDKAVAAAKEMPWEQIVTVDQQAGLIEAVDQLPWFGFKDDIVIRLDSADVSSKTKIDVRSVSRIGRGDIGVNAQRIRDYLEEIDKK